MWTLIPCATHHTRADGQTLGKAPLPEGFYPDSLLLLGHSYRHKTWNTRQEVVSSGRKKATEMIRYRAHISSTDFQVDFGGNWRSIFKKKAFTPFKVIGSTLEETLRTKTLPALERDNGHQLPTTQRMDQEVFSQNAGGSSYLKCHYMSWK